MKKSRAGTRMRIADDLKSKKHKRKVYKESEGKQFHVKHKRKEK